VTDRAGEGAGTTLPSYAQLKARTDGRPPGTAWGVFGDDDELGTVGLLDRGRVLAGLRAAQTGEVVSLNWRVDLPSPHPYRQAPQRTHLGAGSAVGRDDFLSPFYLQYSSQWDGLRHIVMDGRFYNGVPAEVVDDPATTTLGIQHWADHGIVGRGVLLDVAGHLASIGTPIDPSTRHEVTPDQLDATAAAQGVEVEVGDVLLVRTGWCGWYVGLDEAGRATALEVESSPQPGLASTRDMAAWLWDHHVAAVACDNTAVEACPIDLSTFLHIRLIAGLGLALGEQFWLDGLAARCRDEGRWTFLFTSAPLNVPGGVGSPPNALAIL
jgi:hypothetical protein